MSGHGGFSAIGIGIAKGKWHVPEDWELQDKALDAEIAQDFYADSPYFSPLRSG